MNQKFKAIVDSQEVLVDDNLKGYTIMKRQSSFIDYIAVKDDNLFIQFDKGNCALFSNVPVDVIKAAVSAPSIGKFYHSVIKDKFEFTNVGHGNKCITPNTGILEENNSDAFEDEIEEGSIIDDDDYEDEY